MVKELVKRHKSNLSFVLFQEPRVAVARLDGMLILQAAKRAVEDVLHLAGRLVVFGRHQIQMRFTQVSVKLHPWAGEIAVRAVHRVLGCSTSASFFAVASPMLSINPTSAAPAAVPCT